MDKPLVLTPEIAMESDVTYAALIHEALHFLARCGALTMKEQAQHGMKHPAISANECLGMATRALAEAALQIKALADDDEFRRNLR